MLSKGNDIKWNLEARKYFEYIKVALTATPASQSRLHEIIHSVFIRLKAYDCQRPVEEI
jgi:hypothetical protein